LAIKSIKSKPSSAWLSFFIGVSIIAIILLNELGFAVFLNLGVSAAAAPFMDYRDTVFFRELNAYNFVTLSSMVAEPADKESLESSRQVLEQEGPNIKYYAINSDTGQLETNMDGKQPLAKPDQMPDLPAGYSYYWYYDGKQVRVVDHGKSIDVLRLDSTHYYIINHLNTYSPRNRVLLAVKDNLAANPYGKSKYYETERFLTLVGWAYAILGALGLALWVYAIKSRQQKREFDRVLASWAGQVWLEVKLLISVLALALLVIVPRNFIWGSGDVLPLKLLIYTLCSLIMVLCGWWLYLMAVELIVNRQGFISHNLLAFIIKCYRNFEKKYDWQKAMLSRVYALLFTETILALASVIFLIAAINSGSLALAFIAVLLAAAGIYFIYRYIHRYRQTIDDLGKVVDHIELIKNGDIQAHLELAADADMQPAAQNLNAIQQGVGLAVAERMKSERMKMELITNVSHDLKTPLTSIISYTDLLSREEGLPEHVNNYIGIMRQKAERLKNLIQDLFDLSKASSDSFAMEIERIDLARLLRQTLADMEEQINASNLTFRVSIPDDPVYIISDGKKLYRVWENLINNSLKYSLPGSRVFVDLTADQQGSLATIKNTANYEMNFSAEEILQRFVRGDESRSTEGSGLGLSIAQSFAQICGAQFSIRIDGDQFKVQLSFNQL